MKTIHLRCAPARQALLVLILLSTACGLQAQGPRPTVPPSPSNQMQMRLRALTNNAAASQPALPPGPVSPVPAAGGAPAVVPPAAPGTLPATAAAALAASPAAPAPEKEVPGYVFNFPAVDVKQVLDEYAKLVNRTLLMGAPPSGTIILHTQSPLTRSEAIEALQAVLAMNNIALVNIGDKFVKVVPPDAANSAGAAFNDVPASQLPDVGTYMTHIAQLKYVKPSVMAPLIQPYGRMANSVVAIDDNGILVIRDYAENVKRMLEMIDRIDVSVPAVYISEVIPIRYAMAEDIASALNSLGGQGGGTVSVGSSASPGTISGVAPNRSAGTGFGSMGATQPGAYGNTPNSTFGQPRTGLGAAAGPTGTPSSSTPFQARLLNIINRASGPGGGGGGQEPIQIFGQAKIIADQRSNSLLIFATREDMDSITNVIAKLDAPLDQVLIESVIIDYSLGPNQLSYGVSASQQPQFYNSTPPIGTAGGYNNGQQLYNLLQQKANLNNTNGIFSGGLGGGLNYFGNIGNYWNVALSAAASDSHASIIQTPSIQTSQAKPAQFFVGDTVPYVTSTYNYGGAYGNQSSYSQLSVGVELDVTPFINPDGLVVMQIQQEIDDLNGYTTITGVGQIPNTIKRTLQSEITVSNMDTVVLGAFIKNGKSSSRSGVPILQDIPLLGNLFSQNNKSRQREELIVLMRPTVLKTPQIAAINTVKLEQTLPGASQAYAESVVDQKKSVDAQRKKELKNPNATPGFYSPQVPGNPPAGQSPQSKPQPQSQGDDFFPPATPAAPANNNTQPPR
jgi:general secretion pathway protein D